MTTSPTARRLLRAVQALAILGLGLYAAQAAIAVCGKGADAFFETYVYTGLVATGAALCFARVLTSPRERVAWAVLGGGLAAWAAGDAYYVAALSDMLDPPLPSFADALWLALYPACYVALVLLVRERVRSFPRSLWLDGLVGALAVAALGSALVMGAITAPGADSAVITMDLVYLCGDFLLLGFVVGGFALTGWRPGLAWGMLGTGLATSAVADAYFLYQGAIGADPSSTLPAALWPASALIVGFAAWSAPVQRSVRLEGWRTLAMPVAFASIALGLLAVHTVSPLPAAALVLALATLAMIIVRMTLTFRENLELIEGTQREAGTDALTGLANRRRLMTDLAAAIAEATPERPCGLAMFDLDGFKQYNDRFGHPVGDTLLARLGRRLSETVGHSGRAYRLGGDEFCVVASGTSIDLEELSAQARAALTDSGRGFTVGSSYGLVLVPEEATDVPGALSLADERLYEQKDTNRRSTVTRQTSDTLMQVLKECQPELDRHLHDVAELARALGTRVGLRAAELDDVVRAAQLHDVGKVAVPDDILDKDGPLDDSEWEFVRQHSVVGDRILSAAPDLSAVAELVRASHENVDGSGYPDGLVGDEIPLGARVVTICDAYHAMTSSRRYRERMSRADALRELRRCAGAQFDPEIVETFCALLTPAKRPQARFSPATQRAH
jgi:diguanylate cyclase (GGDEF)-like protein